MADDEHGEDEDAKSDKEKPEDSSKNLKMDSSEIDAANLVGDRAITTPPPEARGRRRCRRESAEVTRNLRSRR